MRNLVEHPITAEEAIEGLKQAVDSYLARMGFGDTLPFILTKLQKLIEGSYNGRRL